MTKQDLNSELLDMAMQDFEAFCLVAGVDLTRAYVCILKSKGKSYAQIAIMLGVTRDQVIKMYHRKCCQ